MHCIRTGHKIPHGFRYAAVGPQQTVDVFTVMGARPSLGLRIHGLFDTGFQVSHNFVKTGTECPTAPRRRFVRKELKESLNPFLARANALLQRLLLKFTHECCARPLVTPAPIFNKAP